MDDVIRAAGGTFENADLWEANVSMRLTRPTHISQWEGIIYSDGSRYAAVLNGASKAGESRSHLVVDGSGTGWLRDTESGTTRLMKFDASRVLGAGAGPESFVLPCDPSIGNPLGMFLDPARALRTLESTYDLRFARSSNVDGDPVIGFAGSIRPEALAAIDPNGYLAEHNLPIDRVDVTVRLYDGAPRRIQFMQNGIGYFLIQYSNININVDLVETRFSFDPEGAQPVDVTQAALDSIAGVNEHHVLFEWDETQRELPQRN